MLCLWAVMVVFSRWNVRKQCVIFMSMTRYDHTPKAHCVMHVQTGASNNVHICVLVNVGEYILRNNACTEVLARFSLEREATKAITLMLTHRLNARCVDPILLAGRSNSRMCMYVYMMCTIVPIGLLINFKITFAFLQIHDYRTMNKMFEMRREWILNSSYLSKNK